MPKRTGHRGYIASRPILGQLTPQRVQNLVVRDHAGRLGLTYLLSATEYAMPGCYLMLEEVLNEMPKIEGMIAYSLFMLPERQERRLEVYRRILDRGGVFHAALENLALTCERDIDALEDIYVLRQVAPQIDPATLLPVAH